MLKEFRARKVYLYVLAVITFFVMLWGAIDTASATLGLALVQPSSASVGLEEENGVSVEALYQRRMFFERIADSSVRLLVGGGIFIFLTLRIKKEETA